MLPRWKTQFFIKFFEGGIIMREGNRGQPKEDPFHVFVPLLPLNMAQNDISDSPIPSWNVPGPWNYPEKAVSWQFLLNKVLWLNTKYATKFWTWVWPPAPCTIGSGGLPLPTMSHCPTVSNLVQPPWWWWRSAQIIFKRKQTSFEIILSRNTCEAVF